MKRNVNFVDTKFLWIIHWKISVNYSFHDAITHSKETRQEKEQWRWRLKAKGKEGWDKIWKERERVGNIGYLHKIGDVRNPVPTTKSWSANSVLFNDTMNLIFMTTKISWLTQSQFFKTMGNDEKYGDTCGINLP